MRISALFCCLLCLALPGRLPAADGSIQVAAVDAGAATANPIPTHLKLRSEAALVLDASGRVVYAKQENARRPIASITKLMTAMVVLDAAQPLDAPLSISRADRDLVQLTASRLDYGATLTRRQMLQLALMASENRAASALARTYPGGRTAFVAAMNRKARELGMTQSRFTGPAGLDPGNVSTPRDVATMVQAALSYPLIREATTRHSVQVKPYKGRGTLRFTNTNRLLNNKAWDIHLSKTGYLNEAGRCLAMQAEVADRSLVIVLLNAYGKLTPIGDSNRIRKWLEQSAVN